MDKWTDEEAIDASNDEPPEGWSQIYSTITGQSRWSTFHRSVFKRDSDGALYYVDHFRGSTEIQEDCAGLNKHGPAKAIRVTAYAPA